MYTDDSAGWLETPCVAENLIIGTQIDNYNTLSKLEPEVAFARARMLTAAEGTPEHAAAQAKYDKLDNDYTAALETERYLLANRKLINSVQAERITRGAAEPGVYPENNPRRLRIDPLNDRKQSSRAEYDKMIAEKRRSGGAKGTGVMDKGVHRGAIPAR
jgi:hypothetical protein